MLFRNATAYPNPTHTSTPPATRKHTSRPATAPTSRKATMRHNAAAAPDAAADVVVYSPADVQSVLTHLVATHDIGSRSGIHVAGELTNVKLNTARDWVFWDVTDDSGKKLKCVVWKFSRTIPDDDLRDALVDGAQVVLTGVLEIESRYTSGYQLKVKRVALASDEAGAHDRELAEWRAVLADEGCFEACHKRHVPEYATRIAIVTSAGGSVLHDVTSTWATDGVPLVYKVYPCAVQGQLCVPSVVAQLQAVAHAARGGDKDAPDAFRPDIVMVVRGGGSREDLWEFNRKDLVREVHRLRAEGDLPPIVCAIGHEPDHTLLDEVVDRAHTTPTDAARALAKPLAELPRVVANQREGLHCRLRQALQQHHARYDRLAQRTRDVAPYRTIQHAVQRQRERVRAKLQAALQQRHDRWATVRHTVATATPWCSLAEHANLALLRTDDGADFDVDTFQSGKRGTVVLVTRAGPVRLHYRVGT